MEAKDLRIGNYIDYETEREIVTMQITYEYIRLIHNGNKNFKPIPLTEEWLLKFGFEKEVEYKKKINFSRFHLFQINASNPYNDNKNEFKVNFYQSKQTVELCRIKYVHELQNLFFCLCGEELTL